MAKHAINLSGRRHQKAAGTLQKPELCLEEMKDHMPAINFAVTRQGDCSSALLAPEPAMCKKIKISKCCLGSPQLVIKMLQEICSRKFVRDDCRAGEVWYK